MNLKVTSIGKYRVYYRNNEELERIRKEVFVDEEYKFIAEKQNPLIIDCGSHIGLSVLYFKSIYPESTIISFEPNPENFEILKKNIEVNNLKGVKTVNAALSDKEGKDYLRVTSEEDEPWTWGDTIINNMWGDEEESKKVSIRTVRLSKYINKVVDLLKLDIEGSEQKVLEEIENKLHIIKKIILEYHGTKTGIVVNNFNIIKNVLKKNGFNITTLNKDLKFVFPDFVAELRKTSSVFTIKAEKKL